MELLFRKLRLRLLLSGALLVYICPASFAQWVGGTAKSGSSSVLRIQTPGSPGSGVLVNAPYKDSNDRLLILTAHHVIADVAPNEDIVIDISPSESITIKGSNVSSKWANKDIAVIDTAILTSPQRQKLSALKPTSLGIESLSNLNSNIFVAGFPIRGLDLETEDLRISEGKVQTYGQSSKGKGLIGYSAKTFPGMSGGGAFNEQGLLIGIHVRGEKDLLANRRLDSSEIPTKTGTNYAVSSSEILSLLRTTFSSKEDLVGQFQRGSQLIASGDYPSALKIFKSLSSAYPESLLIDVNYKCLSQRLNPKNHETWAGGIGLKSDTFIDDPRRIDQFLAEDPLRKSGVRIGTSDLDIYSGWIMTSIARPTIKGGFIFEKNPLLRYKQCSSYITILDDRGRKYAERSISGWGF